MTRSAKSAVSKISLNVARDIAFDKLVLSQANVRRIKAGVSVEELAEDIARRGLLQSLGVRPVVGEDGAETGMFEVPAGGRRYRALERLVRQKRLARGAPVPCVVKPADAATSAEEDSLAENVQRAPLHPLDQFRAFLTLREQGRTEEEIAAAFFVSGAVVKQRLRLASVSPKLLDLYAEDALTLDQLMAFTVSSDHQRQEQVYERLRQSYAKEPYVIRRMLTEGAVRACDKRARFIGLDAYLEAGGMVLNDLFQGDDGGWLQDVALVDRLVAEKLERDAEAVRAEGWRWVEVAPDFAYGHTYGLRQVFGEPATLTEEEQAARDALQAEYGIEMTYAKAEDLPVHADVRLGEIEAELAVFYDRPTRFDAEDVAIAGAFVSLDGSGRLRVERGYVRPQDERPSGPETDVADGTIDGEAGSASSGECMAPVAPCGPEPDEDDGLKPIPDRLMVELTAHRTLALRHALASQPDIAVLAALHALVLKLFYRYAQDSCLELDLKSVGFTVQAPGLADTALAAGLEAQRQGWIGALPQDPADLWDALEAFDGDSRQALFAYCVAQSVNAVWEPYARRPRALAHANRLARAVELDMVAAGWTPTVDSYLGRVTKVRILQAVAEAKGQRAADRIAGLKKVQMAEQAQALLEGAGWLPEALRTPGHAATPLTVLDLPSTEADEVDPPAHAIAAE